MSHLKEHLVAEEIPGCSILGTYAAHDHSRMMIIPEVKEYTTDALIFSAQRLQARTPPLEEPSVTIAPISAPVDLLCAGCGFEAIDEQALLMHSYQCGTFRRTVRGGWTQQSEMRALGTHKCRFCDYRDYAEYNVKKHEQRSHFGFR